MNKSEIAEREFKAWAASLPKCVGDEGSCDGSLVGLEHEKHCPMFGEKFATHKDAFFAGWERAIAESQAPQPRNGEYENIPDGRLEPDEHCIPSGYNQCLYCGEPVEAPALYCCEEHEEGRSML